VRMEVNGSYRIAGCGISGVEHFDSTARVR
jgi:hypothetical protein